LGPETPHPDVCSGIRVSVGGAVPEGFPCQRLQLRLNFDVVVNFLHARCKDICWIVVAHVNKAGQFADLGMVHCESFSTRTEGEQIVQWPAVTKVDMVMEISFCIKEKAVLSNWDGGERA
jgi:hypothetical protein